MLERRLGAYNDYVVLCPFTAFPPTYKGHPASNKSFYDGTSYHHSNVLRLYLGSDLLYPKTSSTKKQKYDR